MKPSLILIAVAVTVTLFGVHGSAAAACNEIQTPGLADSVRWTDLPITVMFNGSLDLPLETNGNANSRWQCFHAAVDAWNTAIHNLCPDLPSPLIVDATNPNVWAADRADSLCDDNIVVHKVDDADYTNHHVDGVNAASTGHDHPMGTEHGWINGEPATSLDTDGRLAECKITVKNDNAKAIREADILWFTHLPAVPDNCNRIPWDYDCSDGVDMDKYDYYSVMLHELGHLLGLRHQNQGDAPNDHNVMKPYINPGETLEITQLELDCLKMRYCPDEPSPVQPASWGQIKALYR